LRRGLLAFSAAWLLHRDSAEEHRADDGGQDKYEGSAERGGVAVVGERVARCRQQVPAELRREPVRRGHCAAERVAGRG